MLRIPIGKIGDTITLLGTFSYGPFGSKSAYREQ